MRCRRQLSGPSQAGPACQLRRPPRMYAPSAAADAPAPRADGGDARELLCVRCDAPGGTADALASLATHGAVVLEGALREADVDAAAAALQPFLDDVAARWDAQADALPLSWRKWGITRCPRVNAGKKNVHFDPHGTRSAAVQAGCALAQRLQSWRLCMPSRCSNALRACYSS